MATIQTKLLRPAPGKPVASIVTPVERQANVLEMLSYVHSLGIDHVREADMVWIAEEAYNAPLPPGWTEHVDANGRTYFYNTNLRESLWKHPMDQEFVEIANYWRRALKDGGFWDIDEELAEMEEKIRANLANWMELYDDSGQKFYFNRKTEESLFDDPRHTTYHSLYTRIRFVNMMKEKLPLLALAPRATDPVVNAAELERRQKVAQERAQTAVLRVQAAVRVMLARRRARLMQAKRCLNRVPPELQGKLRLTVQTAIPGTHIKECVISVTTPAKRNRAATKIQAQVRTFLAMRRYKPMRDHRRFLNQKATRIQRAARRFLSRIHEIRARRMARVYAAVRIQCIARAMAARKIYAQKKKDKHGFVNMRKVVLKIQCHVRKWLALRCVRDLRRVKYSSSVVMLQRQAKVHQARAQLNQVLREVEPVQLVFHLTRGEKGSKILPYVWKLGMLPIAKDGKYVSPEVWRLRQEMEKRKREKSLSKKKEPDEDEPKEPPRSIDLFSKVGMESLSDAAACVIQQTFYALQSGQRCRQAMGCAKTLVAEIVNTASESIGLRSAAAPKIQKVFRGYSVRKNNVLQQRWELHFSAKIAPILAVQRCAKKFTETKWLQRFIRDCSVETAAAKIQARWRGIWARKHAARLAEEAVWPVKGWFEYTGMGRDCVQVNVKFFPNPGFDAYRHFRQHGRNQSLLERLHEMQAEIDSCIRMYMDPEEFARMEARQAAAAAAETAAADAAREQREAADMEQADDESRRVEDAVRSEEEAREAALEAERQRLAEEEESISKVNEALANFEAAAEEAAMAEVAEQGATSSATSAVVEGEVAPASNAEAAQQAPAEVSAGQDVGDQSATSAAASAVPKVEAPRASNAEAAEGLVAEATPEQAASASATALKKEGREEEGAIRDMLPEEAPEPLEVPKPEQEAGNQQEASAAANARAKVPRASIAEAAEGVAEATDGQGEDSAADAAARPADLPSTQAEAAALAEPLQLASGGRGNEAPAGQDVDQVPLQSLSPEETAGNDERWAGQHLEAATGEVAQTGDLRQAPETEGEQEPVNLKEAMEAMQQRPLQTQPSLHDLLSPSAVDLPPGWEAVWSEEHEAHYFWHEPTDTVQWDPPDIPSPEAPTLPYDESQMTEAPTYHIVPEDLQNEPSECLSAFKVLTAAAADLESISVQEPSQRSQGSRKLSKGSRQFSKGSRQQREEEPRPPAPLPAAPSAPQVQLRPGNLSGDVYVAAFARTQTRQPGPAAAAMDRTGKPQFYIRPGLVDMAALNKLEQQKMDLRFRRETLADQRRQRHPIPSQVEYTDMMNSQVQGVFHRHIHHHVHYYDEMGEPQPEAYPRKLSGATLEPLKEVAPEGKSKPKKGQKGNSKPVGPAGTGLRKSRSEASLANQVLRDHKNSIGVQH